MINPLPPRGRRRQPTRHRDLHTRLLDGDPPAWTAPTSLGRELADFWWSTFRGAPWPLKAFIGLQVLAALVLLAALALGVIGLARVVF